MASQDTQVATPKRDVLYWTKAVFIRLGVLPFLLIVAIVVFTLMSDNFLSTRNLTNVVRQSVYLMIVSLGQMFALLTGGFDLSVGTILAITSVVGASVMAVDLCRCAGRGRPGHRCRRPRRHRRRRRRRRLQRHRRRRVRRFALHHDARHVVGGLRHRPLPDRRRAGLRHAGRVRRILRVRADLRHSGADLRRGDPRRPHLAVRQPDAAGALLLCRRRQRQGGAALRHQHARHALHHLRALRASRRDRRDAAHRAPRHRRGQYRRLDAARSRSPPASSPGSRSAAASAGSRTSRSARCSSCSSRTA